MSRSRSSDEGAVRERRSGDDHRRLLPGEATQEELIAASGIPYSIVHATQFFNLIKGIADAATDDGRSAATVAFQPMAAETSAPA